MALSFVVGQARENTNVEFAWTPEQTRLRAELAEFLSATLPADWPIISREGPGSAAQAEYSRAFCPLLARRGLLVPHWPREHGGRNASPWEQFIIGEELWIAGEPRGPQYMNVNWIGPTLMRYGSPAQQQQHLPPIARGEVIWCQGFSEPNAGSDLAALRTRADRAGLDYIINGSKIWTSYARQADHCFLLARTGPERKAGIAIFLVPMRSTGITVREIPSLLGEGDIHEVFFEDVRVSAECRLGEEGQGWDIIMFALQNERVGIPRYALARHTLDEAVAVVRRRGDYTDAAAARAGFALAACEAARLLVYRVVAERSGHRAPPGLGAVARWAVVSAERAVSEFVTEFLADGLIEGEGPPLFLRHHMRAIAGGVASGAAEIQLDLIARVFLELPRDANRGL
jgi:alkylation response protein AidB-like acyl-CoA dehydrogenase